MTEIIATIGLDVLHSEFLQKGIIETICPENVMVSWIKDLPDGCSAGTMDCEDIIGLNDEKIVHPNYAGCTTMEHKTFFVIRTGTDLHIQISEVFDRMAQVNKVAKDFVTEIGADRYCSPRGLAGGISAFEFKKGKPNDDWKIIEKDRDLYFPKVKNKELRKEIEKLPHMEFKELCCVFGFPTPQTANMSWISCPSVEFIKEKNCYVIEIEEDCRIAIKPGMEIIKKSEYLALKGE